MSIQWEELKSQILADIAKAASSAEIEKLKVDVLWKKGQVQALMQQMKTLLPEERKEFGKSVNELKQTLEKEFA
ncbi:MAG: phenylalanine--tRNA ligase subunit alpha, partial [Erysipelotrichaceae bacterium]|nr:phenylalanine--tRNA ligase subunit alpha [Erysipelotrichaceae bacterium]